MAVQWTKDEIDQYRKTFGRDPVMDDATPSQQTIPTHDVGGTQWTQQEVLDYHKTFGKYPDGYTGGDIATQQQTDTTPQTTDKKPDVLELIGKAAKGLGDSVIQYMLTDHTPDAKNPLDRTVKSMEHGADIATKGIKTGAKELLGNLLGIAGKVDEKVLPQPSKEYKSFATIASDNLRKSAAEQKKADTANMPGLEKLMYGGAEFAPAMIPAPEIKALETAGPIIKLVYAGLENAAQSALIYNPYDHPEQDKQKALFDEMTQNFVMGAGLKATMGVGGKVLDAVGNAIGEKVSPVVKKLWEPMANAYKTIISRSNANMTDSYYQKIVPSMLGIADKDMVSIASSELKDILSGNKPIDDQTRAFFATPEWKNLVVKNGGNLDNYPSYLKVQKLVQENKPLSTPYIAGFLPTSELHTTVTNSAAQAADALSSGNKELYGSSIEALGQTVKSLEMKGYKVNRQGIVDTIQKLSDHMRAVDDYNFAIAEREQKQALVDTLKNKGIFNDLVKLKQIDSLMRQKVGYSGADMTAESYARYASRKGVSGLDEIANYLQQIGIDAKYTDPQSIIDVANGLPNRDVLKSKIPAPKNFDYEKELYNHIKYPETVKTEAPFTVSREELAVIKAQPDPVEQANMNMVDNKKIEVDLKKETDQIEKTGHMEVGNSQLPLIEQNPITPENATNPSGRDILMAKLTRLNPYAFESDKIASLGPEGGELVARARRANEKAIYTRAHFRDINAKAGITNMTEDELKNLRAVHEGTANPINENVARAYEMLNKEFNDFKVKNQITDPIEKYWPRSLNDAGREHFLGVTEGDSVVRKIADQEQISLVQALKRFKKSLRRGSFEYERILENVPEKYRATPMEELIKWEEGTARRFGTISEFGKNNEIADQLVNKLISNSSSDAEEKYVYNMTQNYLDKVYHRSGNYVDLPGVFRFLKSSMVVSKLNPLTTLGNEFQGWVSSYLDGGIKGLADSMRTGGDRWVKELGLDDIHGKIGDDFKADSLANRWMKVIGMEGSEIRNFARTGSSTYHTIQNSWNNLVKNPADAGALNQLRKYAMFVDDTVLQKALQAGKLPEDELKIGILEGVRQKMFFQLPGERPGWAATPQGSVAYIFHNYLISQLKLLKSAPLHRQLAYLFIISPILGIPMIALRNTLSGKALPQTPGDWYSEALTSGAGGGTPFDLRYPLTNPSSMLKYGVGGYSSVIDVLTKKNKGKAALENFVPGGQMVSNILFPNGKK